MSARIAFVTSHEEVKENVQQFNEDLKEGLDIRTQLSQFRHWYYIHEIDMFGPSKYIGYKNMTTSKYNRGSGLDGRDTERILQKWFSVLPKGSKNEIELRQRLNLLLGAYNKEMKSNALIHL